LAKISHLTATAAGEEESPWEEQAKAKEVRSDLEKSMGFEENMLMLVRLCPHTTCCDGTV
tara:strand:- start:3044 stop:3223 length:180 start_codon:yes stop_codon:yes gene_type:complete